MPEDEYQPIYAPKGENWFRCYIGIDDLEAAQLFWKRYGYYPEKVFRQYGLVWAGPLNDEKDKAK